MFSLNRLLEIFSSKVFLGLFRKVQTFDYALLEKRDKAFIYIQVVAEVVQNVTKTIVRKFQRAQKDVFMFNLNRLLVIFSRKVFLGLFS